jgi:hypothetical protein
VVKRVKAALREAGFTPWIDGDRLDPGDSWNGEIHLALNTCAGAVVVLDQVVLDDSDWVLAEATILAHRYATSGDFRLIPVLLGGARPAALQSGSWAPLRLSEIQPVRENLSRVLEDLTGRAEDIAQQVADAFLHLAPATLDPLLAWWMNEIAVPLRTLATTAPHRLDAAAEALRMDRAAWIAAGRRVDWLAFALLDAERRRISAAVAELAPLVNEQADPIGAQLEGKVTPLWVRLEMTSGVVRGLRGDIADRRMLISVSDPDLASDIIHRAVYCSHKLRLARCTGESGGSLDRLAENCERAIRSKLSSFDLIGTEPAEEIKAALADADPPPVALIHAEGLDEEDMTGLVDRLGGRYPGVVLVFCTPQSQLIRTPPPGLAVVEPPLSQDEATLAMIFRCRILELAGRQCPYNSGRPTNAAPGGT